MDKILTQVETEAMAAISAPQAGGKESRTPKFSRCDFRQAGEISKEQSRAVSSLHETFAAHVSNSLGAYLRVAIDFSLITVEQLIYSEFLSQLPDPTYLASVSIPSLDSSGLIQMDLSLAFPIIDIVLGGLGRDEPQDRDITEIEEQVLESVIRVICRELQGTWSAVLDLAFNFDRREAQTQLSGLMPSSERVLVLTFEVRTPETHGGLMLAFPAVVSNTLLRKLSAQFSHTRRPAASHNQERLRDRLLGMHFQAALTMPGTLVSIERLLGLEPGSVLVLEHRVTEPIRLAVGGKHMFLASPVSCGRQRGAQIVDFLPLSPGSAKE
jgi:flagellar motor switch protein FliM